MGYSQELRLGAYSLGVNLISLAVSAVFFYYGEIVPGILAFIITVTVLLAAVYKKEVGAKSPAGN